MATIGSFSDDPLPTTEQVAEVTKFLTDLEGLMVKLEGKKVEARKVIQSKMSDLHQLIDKWETRFLDTMTETLDEKIETINKQRDKLKSTVDWIKDQRKTKRMSRVFPSSMRASPAPVANEADTEEGLQKAMVDPAVDEEDAEQPEEENVKKHWRVWKALKFPLQPAGVTAAEVNVDLWNEFGPILEESRKSLKRSMLFVGGIVRAYMRRGHKKDEWVAMVRRLEARVEAPQAGAEGVVEGSSSVSSSSAAAAAASLAASNSLLSALNAASGGPNNPASAGPANSAIVSTIWMAISDIYKYRAVPSVKAPLTKQLNYMYANYPMFVEFYLPQLSNLYLCNKDFPLADFLFESCRAEPHFAIQTYFLISSMSQVGPAKWQKRCIKTLKQIIKAIPVAYSSSSISSKKQSSNQSGLQGLQSGLQSGLQGNQGNQGNQGALSGSSGSVGLESSNLQGLQNMSSSTLNGMSAAEIALAYASESRDDKTILSSNDPSSALPPHPSSVSSASHGADHQHPRSMTPESNTTSLRTTTSSLNISSSGDAPPPASIIAGHAASNASTGFAHDGTSPYGFHHHQSPRGSEEETDEEDHILSEFPLGLPTDDHHLMLLLSPRSSSNIPIPQARRVGEGVSEVLPFPSLSEGLAFPSLSSPPISSHPISSPSLLNSSSPIAPIALKPNSLLTTQQVDAAASDGVLDVGNSTAILAPLVTSPSSSDDSISTTTKTSNFNGFASSTASGAEQQAPQITLTTSASQLKSSSIAAARLAAASSSAASSSSAIGVSGRTSPISTGRTSPKISSTGGGNALPSKTSLPPISSSFGDDGYRGDDNKSDGGDDIEPGSLDGEEDSLRTNLGDDDVLDPIGGASSSSTGASSIGGPSSDLNLDGESKRLANKATSAAIPIPRPSSPASLGSPALGGLDAHTTTLTTTTTTSSNATTISMHTTYKVPPEHLYLYSPVNSPAVPEPSFHHHHASSKTVIPSNTTTTKSTTVTSQGHILTDLTSEIKAAVTAAAAAVEKEIKVTPIGMDSSTENGNASPSPSPSSNVDDQIKSTKSRTRSMGGGKSSTHGSKKAHFAVVSSSAAIPLSATAGNSVVASIDPPGAPSSTSPSFASASTYTKSSKAKKHLSVPNDHHHHHHHGGKDSSDNENGGASGSISDSYNSDDPEQELKKLTRIVKPPSAPRVEKNLEVPAGKEYFFTQIKFMRKLIDVSRKLGELYGKPELYKPQLDRELEALSPYIDSGFAYIPTQNGVRTRVLRFAFQDCHPIQTYGRVLYKMIMEVVDLPAHYSKEMADEYVRLTKDIRKISSSPIDQQILAIGGGSGAIGSSSGAIGSIGSSSGAIAIGSSSGAIGAIGSSSGAIGAIGASSGAIGSSGSSIAIGDSSNVTSATGGTGSPSSSASPTSSSVSRVRHQHHHHHEGGKGLVVSASLPAVLSTSSSTTIQSNSASSSVNEAPSAFGDAWKDVRRRLKATSMYSALPHWDIRAYIVKHGDLVLQEQFVMQLLVQFQHIWDLEGLPLKLCLYSILATSYQSGLIEVVPNSISLDKLKKVTESMGDPNMSLAEFFKKQWGSSPEELKRARSNFISSLAAYSVVCYLLQIKDRHNGNIMLDAEGRIFHIDFGYLLAKTIKFERAPFKLTDEFIEVLGGDQSKYFKMYTNLCVLGFLAARKHYEKIVLLVEMSSGEGSAIPCLEGDSVAPNLRARFHLDWNEQECEEFFLETITEARDNWRTQIYDTYQRIVNDIH